jgi:tetratricopeptide (TPR) repeat protein
MRATARLLFVLAATLGSACATQKPTKVAEAPVVIDVPTTVVTPQRGARVDELLRQADAHLAAHRDEEAEALYHQVIIADDSGKYKKSALFGLGFLHDRAGRLPEATEKYLSVLELGRQGDPETDEAALRAVRLLLFQDRFREAEETARRLDPASRKPLEEVALRAARMLGHLSRGELGEAEKEMARGRETLDRAGLGQLVEIPLDVAAFEFARGELLSFRAAQIRFNPLPVDFTDALERRCQLILDAQSAYSETMKSKSAEYAAKAGVRVGELYQSLHADLVSMERPHTADSDSKRMLFEGALRLRYSILLRKARAMMQSTVALIERTGEGGRWVTRAREALDQVTQAERAEEALLNALPVTRAEIEAALADLEAKAKARRSSGPES